MSYSQHLFVYMVCISLLVTAANGMNYNSVYNANLTPLHTPKVSTERRCAHDEMQRRVLEEGIQSNVQVTVEHNETEDGRSFALLTANGDGDWKPIRIAVFHEDLKNPSRYCTEVGQTRPNFQGGSVRCKEEDILTKDKIDILINHLIPQAIQLHAERLRVQPLSGIRITEKLKGPICGSFTIPEDHYTKGVENVDYILYAAAGPIRGNDLESGTAAWAVACGFYQPLKPVVGVTEIAPSTISTDRVAVHTVAHEILHALGYSWWFFDQLDMTITTSGLRGKPVIYALKSPKVLEMGRQHFGCPSMEYVELEDEGESGTEKSHWERRNAKDEMMAGVQGVGFYSNLTIAAMEDTGYYKGNYANGEPMPWGYHKGCNLINQKCLINEKSQFPEMFCDDVDKTLTCTSDRLALGKCWIENQLSVPSYFQYFSDTTEGGEAPLTDFCPVIVPYSNTVCTQIPNSAAGDDIKGFYYGADSRCLDLVRDVEPQLTEVNGLCVKVNCDFKGHSYTVQFSGNSNQLRCSTGSRIDVGPYSNYFNGHLTCPPFEEVCFSADWHSGKNNDVAFTSSQASIVSLLCIILTTLLMLFF